MEWFLNIKLYIVLFVIYMIWLKMDKRIDLNKFGSFIYPLIGFNSAMLLNSSLSFQYLAFTWAMLIFCFVALIFIIKDNFDTLYEGLVMSIYPLFILAIVSASVINYYSSLIVI